MDDLLPSMDLILNPFSSESAVQTSFSSRAPPHPFSYQNSGLSSYLSPESAAFLRRARSDQTSDRRLTNSSGDLRPTMFMYNFPPSQHVDFLAQQRGVHFSHLPEGWQPPLINNISSGDSNYSSGSGRSLGAAPSGVATNVATTATADASMKPRINDAKFLCPVPGCGSTFTRHFNLKGMSFTNIP
jgi:hypothetical protein